MGESRRDEVLDELVDLFLAEGFRGFGIGDLAARLRCSRSTLYLVAPSKEQVVLAAVRAFFRRAAERIEAVVAAEPDPGARLHTYLSAVAAELAPASAAFHADLAAHPPAAEVYADNTRRAARRVQQLVTLGVESGRMRPVDAALVGATVAEVMTAIQRGRIAAATGLDDAAAYAGLADLVVQGLAPHDTAGPRS
jgi:AcrR family transcriptional regulator